MLSSTMLLDAFAAIGVASCLSFGTIVALCVFATRDRVPNAVPTSWSDDARVGGLVVRLRDDA